MEDGGNLKSPWLAQTARVALANSLEVSDTLGWYYKKGLPSRRAHASRERRKVTQKGCTSITLAAAQRALQRGAQKASEQALVLIRCSTDRPTLLVLAGLKG